jgi:hypothetical protein
MCRTGPKLIFYHKGFLCASALVLGCWGSGFRAVGTDQKDYETVCGCQEKKKPCTKLNFLKVRSNISSHATWKFSFRKLFSLNS